MTAAVALRSTDTRDESSLVLWADHAVAAAQIAAQLAGTPFVPASLRVMRDRGGVDLPATTSNIAAALLTGEELGLSPMASLRSIDIVGGTPALRAIALRALLLRNGHDVWVIESNKTRCLMGGRRNGSDHDQEVLWTLDRARDLGISGREQWRKQPTAMLLARATAEIARLVAADAILGIPYIVEEMGDDLVDEVPVEKPSGAVPAKRTAQRRTRPVEVAELPDPTPVDEPPADVPSPNVGAPVDEPPVDEPAYPPTDTHPDQTHRIQTGYPDHPANGIRARDEHRTDEPPEDDPPPDGPRTDRQSRALHAAMRELGVVDRDEGLAMLGGIVGRDLPTTKDLTVAEASRCLDEIRQLQIRAAAARAAQPEDPNVGPTV